MFATAEAAVVVAVVSAILSLTSAIGVELLRRHSVRQLEVLRIDYQRDLERFKDDLARTREADSKVEESQRLVALYRDPLLRSAYDLQSRIYNIARGYSGHRDPEYFRLSTLFVISEFFGWLEIIRKEMQFLDLRPAVMTVELNRKLHRVQDLFATTHTWRDDYYIYRGYQRTIGDLMITQIDPSARLGSRCECIGYAAFVARQSDPQFARWFDRLGRAIEELPGQVPERLICVQHALVDILDFLDPDRERFVRTSEDHRHMSA
jgi:hypothetical protein